MSSGEPAVAARPTGAAGRIERRGVIASVTLPGADEATVFRAALADRLGQLFTVIAGEAPELLDIVVRGEIASRDVSALKLSALRGMFRSVVTEQVSYVNAPVLAEERGIAVNLVTDETTERFRNVITLRGTLRGGDVVAVSGTLSGVDQEHKLIDVFGHALDVPLSDHLLILRYSDGPGLIGKYGALLGEAGINIAGMQVSRVRRAQGAECQQRTGLLRRGLTPATVDAPLPQRRVEQIARRRRHTLCPAQGEAGDQAVEPIKARCKEVRQTQQGRGGADRGGVPRMQCQADHGVGHLTRVDQGWRWLQRASGIVTAVAETGRVDDARIDIADVHARPGPQLAAQRLGQPAQAELARRIGRRERLRDPAAHRQRVDQHAALLLAQGAGRLIRRETDRGMVAVLDPRLSTARYGSFLRESMPPLWPTADPEVALGALRSLAAGQDRVAAAGEIQRFDP